MPRFRRLVVPGFPHHVTQRGVRRQQTFFGDDDYKFYLGLGAKLLKKFELEIWAYCLMPNHVHLVAVPPDKTTMSRFLAQLHRDYARRTNANHDWTGHLWQERFYSVAMDESHALSAMRYVELNPVRAGLVSRPDNWRWSSARANLGLATDPFVSAKPRAVGVDDWHGFLGEALPDDEFDHLRRSTSIGRPIGPDHFIKQIEDESGRALQSKRRGPKKKG